MNSPLVMVLALLPALGWFVLWRFQDKEKEPLKVMLLCLVFGLMASAVLFFGADFLRGAVNGYQHVWQIVVLAFVEEIVKAFMLVLAIELTRHWFTQIVDGLIYGSAVALGFALAENILYLWGSVNIDSSFVIVYGVRSLNTMVAHSLFTGLFGFFYASAYLRKEVFPKKKKEKPWYHFLKNLGEALPLHVTLFHLLPNRPSQHGHYPGSLILEGVLIAGGLHAVFNLLLNQQWNGIGLAFLTYPLLFGVSYLVWRMFLAKVYRKIVFKVKG